MKRELLLLRHGKSDWSQPVGDFERPLKDRGKRGAQRIGVWLWQESQRPDLILSSPAERALVTAEKCCKAMGFGTQRIVQDERLYHGSGHDAVRALREAIGEHAQDAHRVMLVGHNPALEEMLEYLVDSALPEHRDGKLLPTATLAQIQVRHGWSDLKAGSGELLQIVRGKELPKRFPFPAPHGSEGRERPAYYYQQSGVIPFRVQKGELEVLVVRSSQQKHWVVPKGVVGPEESLQDSAANEAYEEAGVEGEVLDIPLGSYRLSKWGAQCEVTMFPLKVTRMLREQDWEERHRGREWLACAAAAKRVRQPELKRMISSLAGRLEHG